MKEISLFTLKQMIFNEIFALQIFQVNLNIQKYMKVTISQQPKSKGISNVFKLKKMMQIAINNTNEEAQSINNIQEPKTMTHASNADLAHTFFNKTQKIKGISNSITVLSSKNRSCSRTKVIGDDSEDKQNNENFCNTNSLNNSIKFKNIARNKSTNSLSAFALQLTKKNSNKSVKEQLKLNNNQNSNKKEHKQRKIKIVTTPLGQQENSLKLFHKSHSSQALFHEKFKHMKKNSHIVTQESIPSKSDEKITMQSIKTSYSSSSYRKSLQKIDINRFKIGKKLGRGRFGNVFMAEDLVTGFLLAIKIVNKAQLKQAKMQDQLLMEIKLQTFMDHPNILKLYSFFHDDNNIYLLLELGEDCLFKVLRRKIAFEQRQTAYLTKQIIEGLKYLHSQKIIHRDLKPQNIMLVNNVVKLADFGWSIYSPTEKRQTFCGTLDYVPPEIVNGDLYDENVDIWSLGILIYELTIGKAPFQGNSSEEETFKKILQAKYYIPDKISNNLTNLIRKILNINPSYRLDLKQIESSPWLREYEKEGRSIKPQIWQFWSSTYN